MRDRRRSPADFMGSSYSPNRPTPESRQWLPRRRLSPNLGYASGTFDVRYHETLDFLRITGALRCKANNFFGYDFN